jgi:hypothetical protein
MLNKRFFSSFAAICLVVLLLQGCAYMNTQTPLDIDFDNTSLGSKTGKSNIYSVLWLVSWGDGGTKAAAEEGGITVIKHADIETYVILFGLYARITTVVYGD